jgi:WhiB family redox-sensing transcriptional regulator
MTRGRKALLPPHVAGPEAVPAEIRWKGACAKSGDVELFDSAGEGSRVDEAGTVCSRCPVQSMCLEYALGNEEFGFWAGTSPEERVKMRNGSRSASPESRVLADRLRAQLRAGRPREHIAFEWGVSLRTLERWIGSDAEASGESATAA